MPELDVTLAGAMSLRRGDRRLGEQAFNARQLRLVTALLVLERDGPLSMDVLAGELWPDRPPTQWKVAVRGLVSQFRRRLVDLGCDRDVVVGDRGRYVVDLGDVRVDLEVAAADVGSARRAVDEGAVERGTLLAGAARSVLSRPVLSGVESGWVERLRDRVSQDHLESLVLLGECRRRLGASADARRVLAEAIGIDPLREDAWRALMRAEAAAGNVARALVAYEDCRRRLADELGVDPAEETQRLHAELLRGVPAPDEVVAAATAPDVEPPVSARGLVPYVGLRAFTARDADRFFGRDAEVQALVERLARYGIVAVVGPSGVGKSSLVRAGLLPALARGAIPDSDTWVAVVMTPTAAPRKALAATLVAAGDDVDEQAVSAAVGGDVDGLHAAAGMLLHDAPSSRLLLVVDQLEELFTLGTPGDATAFVGLLTAATQRLDRRVAVVATLRADFYDRAAEVAGLADLLSHSQFVVPPMDGEQVEAAITGPARRAGVSLEPGLLGRIVADVAGQPGSLPLLQHLLYELWEHRVDRVLTRGAYDDLGGVTGALAHRAEVVYAGLDRDQLAVARRVLLRGVQPGEDGADAKRPVAAAELVGPGDDFEAVEAVVQRLVDARLLVASHDAEAGRTVELAHDALIDAWPRLRAWVDEARGWLLDHRRLTVAAADWAAHDRHDDWLLAGLPLDEAHDLLLADGRGEVDLRLSPVEHDYVTASLAARDRDLDAERERVDHQRRLERRSVRRLQALVAVVACVALAAAGLWWVSSRDARAALARQYAAESADVVTDDAQLALLLALEGHAQLTSFDDVAAHDVATALHAAIGANRLTGQMDGVGEVLDFADDGRHFVTARPDPGFAGDFGVDVRDVASGEVVASIDGLGGNGPPFHAAFDHDGSRVAVGAQDGVIHVWDWLAGEVQMRLDDDQHAGGLANWLEFSPDGRHLVATPGARGALPVLVWDLDRRAVVHRSGEEDLEDSSDFAPLGTFHPDGSLLALVHPNMEHVRVIHVGTWDDALDPIEHAGLHHAGFSPDGRWLALSGDRVAIVDVSTGEVEADVQPAEFAPSSVSWNPDSTQLAFGRPVHVWTVVGPDGRLHDSDLPMVLSSEPFACSMPTFGPDGITLWESAACGGDGFRTWNLGRDPRAEVAWLPGSPTYLMGIDWSPDGRALAASTGEGQLAIWETGGWQANDRIDAHGPGKWSETSPRILDVEWSRDGEVLASAGLDEVAAWDRDGRAAFRAGTGGWSTVTVSPDSRFVAYANLTPEDFLQEPADALVWLLDRSGAEVASWSWGEDLVVEDLDFSPDGTLVAAAARDRRDVQTRWSGVAVWDRQADEMAAFLRTDAPPASVDWDRTGTRLLVATQRPTARAEVWDLSNVVDEEPGDLAPDDALLTTFEGHGDWVQEAVYSPDDRRVATCSGDGTARLWDAASGRELQRVVGGGLTGLCRVRFHPSGHWLALSDMFAGVRVLALDVDELAEIARSKLVRSWTTQECREYLDLDECPA